MNKYRIEKNESGKWKPQWKGSIYWSDFYEFYGVPEYPCKRTVVFNTKKQAKEFIIKQHNKEVRKKKENNWETREEFELDEDRTY